MAQRHWTVAGKLWITKFTKPLLSKKCIQYENYISSWLSSWLKIICHTVFSHQKYQIDLYLAYTVFVQIFEGCNFRGRSKSRIFAVWFSRIICNQPLSSICIVIVSKDLIFMDEKLPAKTAKITSLKKFVHMWPNLRKLDIIAQYKIPSIKHYKTRLK